MKTVLIVDDNKDNLYFLEIILKGNGFEVTRATNGSQALESTRIILPDLIISDILMPIMDGFTLCRKWKEDERLKHIPFIFYTATYTEPKDEKFALSLGADRFILKPQEPEALMNILTELFEEKYAAKSAPTKPLGEEMEFFRRHNEILFKKLEKKMADLEIANQKLRKSLIGTIKVMSLTVETRDPYTAGHQKRVSSLACAIAQEMGLPNDKVDNIRMAGIIHDIGKIAVPAEILVKPGKLSDIEMSLIKVHSQAGYDILKDVELPYVIAQTVLQHHERMDGSGYPDALKGDRILIEARIIAVADVAEAMASHRPYRPALGIEAALEEIEKNAGIIYDREVAEVCLRLFREKGFEFE